MRRQRPQPLFGQVIQSGLPVYGRVDVGTLQELPSISDDLVVAVGPDSFWTGARELCPDGRALAADDHAPVLAAGVFGLGWTGDVQPGDQGGVLPQLLLNAGQIVHFTDDDAVLLDQG